MIKTINIISNFSRVLNNRVQDVFVANKNTSFSGAGNGSAKAFIFSDVCSLRKDTKTVIWAVNDYAEQETVMRALNFWSDFEVFSYYKLEPDPSRMKYVENKNRIAAIEFSAFLGKNSRKVTVVPFNDLLDNYPDYEEIKAKTITLKIGEEVNITGLFELLINGGYSVVDDPSMEKGTYHMSGEVLTLYPVFSDYPVNVNIAFDKVESIVSFDHDTKETIEILDFLEILPARVEKCDCGVVDIIKSKALLIEDELDIVDEYYNDWNKFCEKFSDRARTMSFVSFNEDNENHQHLHYISVMKYRGGYDLVNDLREKKSDEWRVVIATKDKKQIKNLLDDNNFEFETGVSLLGKKIGVFVLEMGQEEVLPLSFQNPELKLAVITDKDISFLSEERKQTTQKVYLDFLTSLKKNDYVVHANHGIGRFCGLDKRTVSDVTREYLKILYAENDKLFVPIDQADKVNKFIGADDQQPRLTRLGSAEWNTITKKIQKETEAIAKELLQLYAERKNAKGFACKYEGNVLDKFSASFPYEETPGQIKAINDVLDDMARPVPMDRLVCGDVGFGKTEVAMRAAFKAVLSKRQVALIAPITILADQHFRSFKKRMDEFNIRVELLSRFRTAAEQKVIIKKLERGEVDIVIGTHRLLQPDLKFKNLGLVIVDEEQRFGVKQKEAFKKMRREVHMLTLTATPIPRTLNIALNKLRDISTITTPPPGRLPIITEVRRYSMGLIRDAILRELSRGGQVYFLHNRVQTIDAVADKLKALIPEARFQVAHGKLGSHDLEERILSFKDHKYDVLISSTIIENGIDLSNANTLIVNNAERLGLAQLYQLRGRVGRGKTQAYAYFLYHGQRLKLDAKKRLRAIVEASELGSGFHIAMKDLEIRGAGDILGAKQHGAINVVGVSHFIRMLNKAVDDLKEGKVMQEEGPEEVSVELPLTAYIPDTYIVNSKDKINAYQKMSAADNLDYLSEIKSDLLHDYGKMPTEVLNLFRVLELKILAKKAKLVSIKTEALGLNKGKEVVLHMSGLVKPENIANLLQYKSKWYISGTRLRIGNDDLGMNWFDTLRESVKCLTGSIKNDNNLLKS